MPAVSFSASRFTLNGAGLAPAGIFAGTVPPQEAAAAGQMNARQSGHADAGRGEGGMAARAARGRSMKMARVFCKNDISACESMRDEFTCNGERDGASVVRCLASAVVGQLRLDPARYRAFGPYWWVVKRILIDNGFTEFGSYVDRRWHDRCCYGNDFDSLLAAWDYFAQCLERGRDHAKDHPVSWWLGGFGDESCAPGMYHLVDMELEARRRKATQEQV